MLFILGIYNPLLQIFGDFFANIDMRWVRFHIILNPIFL